MSRSAICVIVLFTLCIVSTGATDKELIILRHEGYKFENKNCAATSACTLKWVKYVVEDYEIGIGDEYNYGTRFFARYRTSSLDTLEDYSFVQFIKGSVYTTDALSGKFIPEERTNIYHFGAFKLFNFPQRAIDSDSLDPAYCTFPDQPSRHFGCRWNKVADSFSTKTELLYGVKRPTVPELYMVDHPASAFAVGGVARNISLQFKTCIYKTKDVPKATTPQNINFAEPISCYDWDSSFLYNHQNGKFERRPEALDLSR